MLGGDKASKKLLAAVAVLAVAFVVLAAIPAVDAADDDAVTGDATTSTTYTVVDGVATVETFDQLKSANADSTVTKIVISDSLTITESFSTVKSVNISKGTVSFSGANVVGEFASVSGDNLWTCSVQCEGGASLHISGLIENVVVSGKEDAKIQLSLFFGIVSEASDFYLTGTTIYGTLNVGICEYYTEQKYPWPIGSSKLNVPAEKTLVVDKILIKDNTVATIDGALEGDVLIGTSNSSLTINEGGSYKGTITSYYDKDNKRNEADVKVTAGEGGFVITLGSIDFSGAVAERSGNSIVIRSGEAKISDDFEIPAGMTLTVNKGAKLTIDDGATLAIAEKATLNIEGDESAQGEVRGSVNNNGTVNNNGGKISGATILNLNLRIV